MTKLAMTTLKTGRLWLAIKIVSRRSRTRKEQRMKTTTKTMGKITTAEEQ